MRRDRGEVCETGRLGESVEIENMVSDCDGWTFLRLGMPRGNDPEGDVG